MATPTFLAGFCTVLASILAYGTTQTHLLYSNGMPPACALASCSSASPHPGNGGTLGRGKSARHAIGSKHGARASQPQQTPERPATGGSGGSRTTRSPGAHGQHGAPPQRHPAGPHGSAQRPRVAVVYQTTRRSSGQFIAAVTIINRGKTVLTGWQLGMQYRRASISQVWNAHWIPASPKDRHGGLVAALTEQRPLRPGMSVRFVFLARGAAGPPRDCAFDGFRCRFLGHRPRDLRRPHTHVPGRGHAHHPGQAHGHGPGKAKGHNAGSSRAHNPGSARAQLTVWVHHISAKPGHGRGQAHGKGRRHAKGRPHAKGQAGGKARPHAMAQPHARARPHARGRPHAKGHARASGRHPHTRKHVRRKSARSSH